MLVVMALYNMTKTSIGLSHHGFFHWRTHIAHFIDKNWNYLIGPTVRRGKKWTGTVSGTLSCNSPAMFQSGLDVIHEAGWWKLTHSYSPKKYMELS